MSRRIKRYEIIFEVDGNRFVRHYKDKNPSGAKCRLKHDFKREEETILTIINTRKIRESVYQRMKENARTKSYS